MMYINLSKLARKNKYNLVSAIAKDTLKSPFFQKCLILCKKYRHFNCVIKTGDKVTFYNLEFEDTEAPLVERAELKNSIVKKNGVPCHILPIDDNAVKGLVVDIGKMDYCISEEYFIELGLNKVFPDYKNKTSCVVNEPHLLCQAV